MSIPLYRLNVYVVMQVLWMTYWMLGVLMTWCHVREWLDPEHRPDRDDYLITVGFILMSIVVIPLCTALTTYN